MRFSDCHLAPFIKMNADPEVMVHFPAPYTAAQTTGHFERSKAHWDKHGFGLFALERLDTGEFIGFTGLTHPPYKTPFSPCVEIGWRLNRNAWGHGYAFEAAQACLERGVGPLGLAEIVSFTARENLRSQSLMQRLAMKTDAAEDFKHPMLEKGHPLSWHVLYRLAKP